MYREILLTLLPIVLCMGSGYCVGRVMSGACKTILCKTIGPAILLLLFAMGVNFGGALRTSGSGIEIFGRAMVYASISTITIGGLVIGVFGAGPVFKRGGYGEAGGAFLSTVKECFVALAAVALGWGVSHLIGPDWHREWSLGSFILLYLIIAMIGLDISDIKVATLGVTTKAFVIPLLVVVGSMGGGVAGSLLMGDRLSIGLVLTSGFGWFSMSGALVGHLVDSAHGAMALLTDLFRELIAIVVLYLTGTKFPGFGIAASGAAAMDSTLPIIRKTCPTAEVSTALVSGFILTILAPMLIAFFASIG